MRTLSGNYGYVYLNSAGDNPVTVTSTGSISSKTNGIALHLEPPADNPNLYWNAANYGRITGQGSGVVIENGGRLVNGSSTSTGAYISGGLYGVSLPKGAGGVVNYGTMAASSAEGIVVKLAMGGQVRNFGLLEGLNDGLEVEVDGAPGTVANYGTMTSQPGRGGGVLLLKGGTVVNGSPTAKNAVITGGVQSEVAATVTNYGSISGTSAVFFSEGGNIVNRGGITGINEAVEVFDGATTIANYGTMRATGTASSTVRFEDLLGAEITNGSLTNAAHGYIGGSGFAIYAHAAPLSVTNAGTIAGGIYLRMGGMVTNGRSGSTGGLVSGASFGVSIEGAAGTIVNYGMISASSLSGSAVRLFAGGLVRNFGVMQAANGVSLAQAPTTLDNHGIIRGISSMGGVAVALGDNSYLKNSAGGYIGSAYGIGVFAGDMGASVANGGIIANGIYFENGGSVVNGASGAAGGLITGIVPSTITKPLGYQAISIGGATGNVTNFGTIEAANGAGVRLKDGGVLQNAQPGALISGTYLGVGIGAAGTVINLGTITASGSSGLGINLKNSFDHTVTNAGTITGAGGTAVAFGAGNDRLIVGAGAKFNGIVIGGPGANEIDFKKTGKLALGPEYVGFSVVRLGNGAANTLTVAAADFSGIAGSPITIYGGNRGNTITAALPAADKLVLHGGAGADTFDLSLTTLAAATVAGGSGGDRLVVTNAGSIALGGLSGVETIALSSGGKNTLVLADGNFSGVAGRKITVLDGNAGDTVTAALPAADRVVLRGGSGNDSFFLAAAGLTAADSVQGGGGRDRLVLTSGGTSQLSGVSGVETYRLANGAADTVTLGDGNFVGISGTAITVFAGNAGDTVNATAVGAAHRVVFVGGTGRDIFTGGAGADTVEVSASNLGADDRLRGAAGNDRLLLLGAGAVTITGVAGIETIVLSSAAKNTLTLATGNFAGVTGNAITVVGGDAGNRISEAAVTGADLVTMKGGAEADTLIAGPHAVMTGGGGSDLFEFTSPGTSAGADRNTVTDFVHGSDKLAFSNAGFHLGLAKAGAAPRPLPTALFSTRTNGTFDKPGERFAYDNSTGRLYFDADGNGASHSRELVATLANHPTLTAGDLFFVA
jgi:Ca2+-binding RTX toxin-like protein